MFSRTYTYETALSGAMMRSSTSPTLSCLSLETDFPRICFVALQPRAMVLSSSTLTPVVVEPAICAEMVPTATPYITLIKTAVTVWRMSTLLDCR
jgi:hypothetical protein